MFTGLVEGIGTVCGHHKQGPELLLTIEVPETLLSNDGCQLGDSISINGCCLTVTEISRGQWTFQAGEETLSKTNLGDLSVGSPVNLERALLATARLGGHIVQGHVDGIGQVASIREEGGWTYMHFQLSESLASQLVPKGSVAVDGVSLTVVDVTANEFFVALIPHTLGETTLGTLRVGDRVNIETDIIGKYVQRWMQTREAPPDLHLDLGELTNKQS